MRSSTRRDRWAAMRKVYTNDTQLGHPTNRRLFCLGNRRKGEPPVRRPQEILDEDELHLARLGYSQVAAVVVGGSVTFHLVLRSSRSSRAASPPSVWAGTTAARRHRLGLADPGRLHHTHRLLHVELVSAYPTSGGIYWWAAKLGGPKGAAGSTSSAPIAIPPRWPTAVRRSWT